MNSIIHNLINSFYSSENKIIYFSSLSNSHKAEVLHGIGDKFKLEIMHSVSESDLIDIFKNLDSDEITDIIQVLSKRKQKAIISKLNSKLKEKVNFLLKFASNSAAGIMSLNYLIIYDNSPKKEILSRIEKHINSGKKEPTLLIIDDNTNEFLGELRISNFLFEKSSTLFSNLKKLPQVIYNEDQEEVIDIFKKNKHEKVVVFDSDNTIMGIIHARDIFKVIEAEETEDFYGLAGLDIQEDISDNAIHKVKFRLGWLIINLGTAFIAASVVTFFEDTISKYVLLAAFMPIIAGMGGNSGTQTTAILIRSLALKKIDSKALKRILGNEMIAGVINGLIIGSIVTLIAYIFNADLLFGLIAGIAIVANMLIAAIFGTIVPLILKSLGFDPASSSTVFVTTSTDVLGFFIFLGLASIFLI